jgi:lysophospholipid acyltransferase (LPLAT)-like uncharacterized protein
MRAKILSFIGWFFISVWGATVRVRYVNRELVERLRSEGRNVIFAFWHGRQFLLVYNHRNTGIVLPASESRDGEIQAGILRRFGYGVVRGSSKRKGDRALLGLVDGLRKGRDIGLAVDGPRGPLYEVKQGVTYLAGKLDQLIVPVSTGARRSWILEKIWDKYLLPVPFTQGVIVYGDPIAVSGIDEQELESKRRELTEALNRAMELADACGAGRC